MKPKPQARPARSQAQNPRRTALRALAEVLDEGKSLSECASLRSLPAAGDSGRGAPEALRAL
jgi:hypothetical protein